MKKFNIVNILKRNQSLNELRLIKTEQVEKPPFLYLQQFYEFEFSTITKSDTDENGLYDYKILQKSWHHNYGAYLLYIEKLPVGLAVINLASQIDFNPNTRDVAEFFVMPKYRNRGFGEIMAMQLFDTYPGKWEVRQLYAAHKARKFWLQVINKYTNGNYSDLKCDTPAWKGWVQKFNLIR